METFALKRMAETARFLPDYVPFTIEEGTFCNQ
jgi:hypothetical protein